MSVREATTKNLVTTCVAVVSGFRAVGMILDRSVERCRGACGGVCGGSCGLYWDEYAVLTLSGV
ncbi:hypothetical protein IFR05_009831 [Cadophora sp. M221]|nr:hypothetical protein IFR05_009831 [Cadophora sp. M221]